MVVSTLQGAEVPNSPAFTLLSMERLLAVVQLKRLMEGPEVDQTPLEKLVLGLVVREQRQAVPVVVDPQILLEKYSVVPAHLRAIS
jgi:hypothetical protein